MPQLCIRLFQSYPYHNNAYKLCLALNICEGLSPEFNTKVPQSILDAIKICLDANPSNRPDCKRTRIFHGWTDEFSKYASVQSELNKTEIVKQIEDVEKLILYHLII